MAKAIERDRKKDEAKTNASRRREQRTRKVQDSDWLISQRTGSTLRRGG
jgi:hypothetical protein